VNILLIEDAEPDVFLVREALKSAGLDFQLTVLDDGEKALHFIDALDRSDNEVCPHVILLDLNLPRCSGEEILDHIRRSDRCKNIPVLVITSSDSPRDKVSVSNLGASLYFRKPSRLDEFMRLGLLVRELIEADSGRRAVASGR
jgi:DNA-binding response OmpR family regulator